MIGRGSPQAALVFEEVRGKRAGVGKLASSRGSASAYRPDLLALQGDRQRRPAEAQTCTSRAYTLPALAKTCRSLLWHQDHHVKGYFCSHMVKNSIQLTKKRKNIPFHSILLTTAAILRPKMISHPSYHTTTDRKTFAGTPSCDLGPGPPNPALGPPM
jgi:hypothetical protein